MLEGLFTPQHLMIILILALVLFGPKKLPELGNALGRTIKEFKAGARGTFNEEEEVNKKSSLTADSSLVNAETSATAPDK